MTSATAAAHYNAETFVSVPTDDGPGWLAGWGSGRGGTRWKGTVKDGGSGGSGAGGLRGRSSY